MRCDGLLGVDSAWPRCAAAASSAVQMEPIDDTIHKKDSQYEKDVSAT